ncbi:MAG: ACT domain-containing protein [Bacillota bacterium]|jgi:hypothetical protein
MFIKQISVFLENKKGRLANVTGTLAEAGVNLRAMSMADTSDFGILRLIVDDNAKAMKVLQDAGFAASQNDVIAVAFQDEVGAMARTLKIFEDNAINVEYLYVFFAQNESKVVTLFRVVDSEAAVKILKENGVCVLEEEDIK